MVRQWIPLLLDFGLPIILLIPDGTRLKNWFKEYIKEFQYLIPPMNMIQFVKSDGVTTSNGGREKCSFFCHGFQDIITHQDMAIEMNDEGKPQLVPVEIELDGIEDEDLAEPRTQRTDKSKEESIKSSDAVKKRKATEKPNEAKESMVVDDSDEEENDLLDCMMDLPRPAPPAKRFASDLIPAVKKVISEFSDANDGQPSVNLDNMQGSIVFKGENSTGIIPIGSATLEYLLDCYAERQIHIPNQSEEVGAAEEKKDGGEWFDAAVE